MPPNQPIPPATDALHRLSRRSLIGGLVVSGLAGCGFRLRGPLQMAFRSLRCNLSDASGLGRELRAQLEASGVHWADAAPPKGQAVEPTDVILDVLTDQRERAVVGVTATGQVRELQLRVRFKYRLRTPAGKELISPTELLQERELSFTEAQVLGKETEEALLYRDMQSDVVRQVMYRMAAVKAL